MMQQVATKNTEIAAFASAVEKPVSPESNSTDEFSTIFSNETQSYARPSKTTSSGREQKPESASTEKSRPAANEDTLVAKERKEAAANAGSDEVDNDASRQSQTEQKASESNKTSESNKIDGESTLEAKGVAESDSNVTTTENDDSLVNEFWSSGSVMTRPEIDEQSHAQLVDLIEKLLDKGNLSGGDNKKVQGTQDEALDISGEAAVATLELKEQASDFQAQLENFSEQEDLVIPDSLLQRLLASIGQKTASDGSQEAEKQDLTVSKQQTPVELDQEILTELLSLLGKEQASSPQGVENERLLSLDDTLNPKAFEGDLELLSLLIDSEPNIYPAQPPVTDLGQTTAESETALEPKKVEGQDILPSVEVLGKGMPELMATDKNLKTLINLPEEKLEKVLTNLAERLVEANKVTDNINKKALSGVEHVSPLDTKQLVTDFVGALKAGLNEFKQQLKQGHEPGIDLNALVAEASGKVSELGIDVTKNAKSVEQATKAFAQILDLGQRVNQGLEQQINHSLTYEKSAIHEIGQTQLETTKLTQAHNSQSDKPINISKPEGHQQLTEKVRWMVNQKNLQAEIRLDPAELGSISVKVNLQGDAASVSFVVQSQQARDSLEQAVPRLREMLAEKGIELGQSSVQQENSNQSDADGQQTAGNSNQHQQELQDDEHGIDTQQRITNGALGGIDYFV